MSFRLLTNRVTGRVPSARLFTTTPLVKKSATEAAKETIQTANKKAGEAGVAAIEKGQQAASTLKSTIGLNTQEAEASASQSAKKVAGSAKEMTGEAKGKANEIAGEAKGKASELAGEAKGKKEEIKRKI